ncbi:BsuPI-related putative proteinase inhibitor [Guptibacillus hwajinpoensis]|uniref:Intracellular proteinase inhibitor BsuPI domain-containing protein n=1 Tax=Guptibacillus hwajinpoensis TaxID=208199 RepID=A0ABU0K496_9BACL|nr:BsuPI-related putative proteinase inhibitor [Alkalihalobacillus hemicentroti]MDQ0484190.1 hypothetical protein [Alkalihalobacillus hemicentroti]
MVKYFTVGTIVLLMLSGCGEENSSMNTNNNKSEQVSGSSGIVAGSMEPSLTFEEQENGTATFLYTIQNQTEQVQTITLPSSQKYEYKLYNEKGEHLKTYSADKSFVKKEEVFKVKQAEILEYPITIDQLSKGTYTLDVWLATEGAGDYKKTINFTIE